MRHPHRPSSGSEHLTPVPSYLPQLHDDDLFDRESTFDPSEYITVLRRHWRLLAAFAVIGFLVGLFMYLNTPKTFLASTRIHIERRPLSPLSDRARSFEMWWNPEFYPTQYEILRSRGLAERVVRDLQLWNDPTFNPAIASLSSEERQQAATAAEDDAFVGGLARRLLGSLSVSPQRETQLVDIAFRSSDPELSMRVANGFARAYIAMGEEKRQETVEGASVYLQTQIETLKQEIAETEARLQAYSRDSDLVTMDSESSIVVQRLQAANQDYIAARNNRIQKEVRYNELLTAPAESIADTLTEGMVGELRSELNRLERQYAADLQTYKEDFPAMVELRARVDAQRENLAKVIDETVQQARDQAKAEYQTALRAERALAGEFNEMKDQTLDASSAAVKYNTLRAERDTRRQLLDELLRMESEVATGTTSGATASQLDVALLPGGPISPNLRKMLMTGLGGGLLLGFGLIFLFEFLDRSIKTPDELEKRIGLPTLAVIPDVSGNTPGYGSTYIYAYGYGRKKQRNRTSTRGGKGVEVDLVPQHSPRLAVSEAYRSLRTALLLSSADTLQVIAVTSATAGEGKTATASNLATVMAQLGRRVLLIDADLRKPRIHKVFRVSNRTGLVSYLVGQVDHEKILLSRGVPGLVVVPSGPIPPNPSELLASERMRFLIQMARERFDTVVIDTPPTLPVTDSTIIGHMSDGVVLCVRAGQISREEVKACSDRLRLAGIKILGTVLNGYLPPKGYYKKDYYYHYEAYGDSVSEKSGSSKGAVA